MYAWLTGSQSDCQKAVDAGLAWASATDVHRWDMQLLAYGVAASLSHDDLSTADSLLEKLRPMLPNAGGLDACIYHYLRTWRALYARLGAA